MHKARKRFGQHFLHDPYVIERIIQAISPHRDESLVEIGPGLGALTSHLLPVCGRMDVVELDRDVIPLLRASSVGLGELTIHEADALKFDFSQLADGSRPLRLIGNLPYNISTPLLFHLFKDTSFIKDMHFMLQKEVVDRMVAGPGSKTYGRLSVMTQYHCHAETLLDVSPGAFRPPPKVDSAVIRLVPHTQPPVQVDDFHGFGQLVLQLFNLRRKTLRRILKGRLSPEQIEALDIDPQARPETLDMAAMARIYNAIQQSVQQQKR